MFASLSVLNFLTYHNPLFFLSIALINFSRSSKNFGNAHWLIYSIESGNKKGFYFLIHCMCSTERKLLSSYILQFTNNMVGCSHNSIYGSIIWKIWLDAHTILTACLFAIRFSIHANKNSIIVILLVIFTHYSRRIFHY